MDFFKYFPETLKVRGIPFQKSFGATIMDFYEEFFFQGYLVAGNATFLNIFSKTFLNQNHGFYEDLFKGHLIAGNVDILKYIFSQGPFRATNMDFYEDLSRKIIIENSDFF